MSFSRHESREQRTPAQTKFFPMIPFQNLQNTPPPPSPAPPRTFFCAHMYSWVSASVLGRPQTSQTVLSQLNYVCMLFACIYAAYRTTCIHTSIYFLPYASMLSTQLCVRPGPAPRVYGLLRAKQQKQKAHKDPKRLTIYLGPLERKIVAPLLGLGFRGS